MSVRCGVTIHYNGITLCNVQLCGIEETEPENVMQPELESLVNNMSPDILVVAGDGKGTSPVHPSPLGLRR